MSIRRGKKKDSWNNNQARNPYSIKPWKDVRKDKIINCPTNDPILVLVGAVLKGGYLEEGEDYFNGTCKSCTDGYNYKYCGSYWTDIAGVNYSYIKRKAREYGGVRKGNYHTI